MSMVVAKRVAMTKHTKRFVFIFVGKSGFYEFLKKKIDDLDEDPF